MKKILLLFMLCTMLSGCTTESTPLVTATPVQSSTPIVTATPSPTNPPSAAPEQTQPLEETLTVHFIDVGQADSALLECGGKTMLIDGGNVADSSLVVSYLKKQGVEHIDYMVSTHAHEDHVGGLSGPLNTCTVGKVYSPATEYDSKAFSNFAKYVGVQGLTITTPEPDESFSLATSTVTLFGPREDFEETNNTSIVLRVDFGETSFLFTGDAEREAEASLLDAGCNLNATVLKVGHHGSDTSTSYPFLREVMPQYAVISVGTGNSYGHPTDDTLSRLRDADVTVYRTDLQGDIIATSDGHTVHFSTQRSTATPTNPTVPQEDTGTYIGNKNSHVFHLETCSSLPAEKNRVLFDTRTDALADGFRPCSRCKP